MNLLVHRRHLAAIVTAIDDVDAHNHLRIGRGRELQVIGRAKPAVGHLHLPRLGIGRRDASLLLGALLPRLLLRLQLGHLFQSLLQTGGLFPHGPLTGGLLPTIARRGIGLLRLGPQGFQLRLGLGVRFLQRGTTAKGRTAGTGTHPHPVLGNAIQFDQTRRQQRGHALGQQLVEQLAMLRAEIGQGMVVDRDSPTDPTVNMMMLAKFVQLPGAADPVNGRVQPERHEDLGIDGIASRLPLHRGDPSIQRRKVQLLREFPDGPRLMVARNQIIDGHGQPFHLVALGSLHPRFGWGAFRLVRRLGRQFEQSPLGRLRIRRLIEGGVAHGIKVSALAPTRTAQF